MSFRRKPAVRKNGKKTVPVAKRSLVADEELAKALQKEEQEFARATSRPPIVASPHRKMKFSGADLCLVPCIIGKDGVCVEMMVDTGAKSSFMALSLAEELNLPIDTSYKGVAAGVGRVPIVGMVRSLSCELGHVQFNLDFRVMDTPNKMLLLGLDLMRRYKCIVDLERDVVVFGGRGGVEIPLMPGDEKAPKRYVSRDGPEISV